MLRRARSHRPVRRGRRRLGTVRAEADGQTVRWWLYGGDDRINRYIDEHVVPAAAEHGVTLERVPVTDTADAVQRVVAEVQAGEEAGSVDLIWLNGENFALGKRAGLWLEDWAGDLPNRRDVDPATVATDFGVEVDGQESPWSRALFVYAHDEASTPPRPVSWSQYGTSLAVGGGLLTLPVVLLPFVDRDPQVAATLSLVFLVPPLCALAAVGAVWRRSGPVDRRHTAGPRSRPTSVGDGRDAADARMGYGW